MEKTKTLVAFFSASGTTAKLAERLAAAIGADLHEIKPETPYTSADLDWTNRKSRSSVEMGDKAFRPAIANGVAHMEQYGRVFLAFPIWWYTAPTILYTFLGQYDFSGVTLIPLATSGGSGMGSTGKDLAKICPDAVWKDGRVFSANADESSLRDWAEQYR